MTQPAAAAVVVLHDSEPELARLLASLHRDPAPPRLVVVDSGSRDGGAALARAHGAEVLVLDGNPGFGAASNAGLERVREDVAILLNPDCEALDGSLSALAALAARFPRALHAPRLLDPGGTVQRSAHPLPGIPGALLPAAVPPGLLPRALRERAEPHRATRPRTVGWAIGACLAAATATFRELGPFDPSVHLLAEDLELCLRARARGIPTVLHPALGLRHAGGHALLRGGERYEAIARRRREAVLATRGPRALALDDAAQALTFGLRAAVRGSHSREARQLRALRRVRSAPSGPAGGRGEE
jgi:N-acetylglucosaminyl-diphospho-decaprenol L-rhamnosyltransferase